MAFGRPCNTIRGSTSTLPLHGSDWLSTPSARQECSSAARFSPSRPQATLLFEAIPRIRRPVRVIRAAEYTVCGITRSGCFTSMVRSGVRLEAILRGSTSAFFVLFWACEATGRRVQRASERKFSCWNLFPIDQIAAKTSWHETSEASAGASQDFGQIGAGDTLPPLAMGAKGSLATYRGDKLPGTVKGSLLVTCTTGTCRSKHQNIIKTSSLCLALHLHWATHLPGPQASWTGGLVVLRVHVGCGRVVQLWMKDRLSDRKCKANTQGRYVGGIALGKRQVNISECHSTGGL